MYSQEKKPRCGGYNCVISRIWFMNWSFVEMDECVFCEDSNVFSCQLSFDSYHINPAVQSLIRILRVTLHLFKICWFVQVVSALLVVLNACLYNQNVYSRFLCSAGVKSLPVCLCLPLSPPQSQGSPYSMSGQCNVRALWANCKGEGRQNQVCVSQPVWYIQRKEPWNTKACWWVSWFCVSVVVIHHTSWPCCLSTQCLSFQYLWPLRL